MSQSGATLLERKESMSTFTLEQHQLTVGEVHRNLPPSSLYEHAIRYEKDASIAENGALVAYSGAKTGRSPKDKRVVKHPDSEKDVWWGPVNIPLDAQTFAINRERAIDYLNTRDRLYCFDGFAGWDPKYRIKVRVICSRPYHALFMHTMLIRPTPEELASFGKPDFVIYNAGAFPANRLTAGMASTTSVALSLEDRELVILGTEYAGEMKKGVFTVANYLTPKRGILSMHCSATADKQTGRSSLLFGLSGTGKTTLSADPKRHLIGDDEHCWSDDGIFNIEGRLLRQGDQPDAGERAGHLPGAALRRRAGERRARRRPHASTSPTPASRRTRAAPIRSSSSATRRSPASPAIRPTSSS